MDELKPCPVCGTLFKVGHGKRYCSKEHRWEATNSGTAVPKPHKARQMRNGDGVRFIFAPIIMDIKDGFMVWTHKDAGEVIRAIPGVHRVNQYETLYFVDLDPRYDREFLRAEIEAQIKINFSEVTP